LGHPRLEEVAGLPQTCGEVQPGFPDLRESSRHPLVLFCYKRVRAIDPDSIDATR
jgi:hypothetical protein